MPATTIRGTQTATQATGSGSVTVSWPAGTAAGDLCLLHVGGDTYYGSGSITTPSGWTVVRSFAEVASGGANYSHAVFSRTLTAADITTGHVAVTVSANYGAFPLGSNQTIVWAHAVTISGPSTPTVVGAAASTTNFPTLATTGDVIPFVFASRRGGSVTGVPATWNGYNGNFSISGPLIGYSTLHATAYPVTSFTPPVASAAGVFATVAVRWLPAASGWVVGKNVIGQARGIV